MRQRKPNRLTGYNYSKNGYYFVTACTKNRIEYFGAVENGEMVLNEYGKIADKYWRSIPDHYNGVVKLDKYMIMPNHIHGIIIISKPLARRRGRIVGTEHCSVPTMVPTMEPNNIKNRYGLLSKNVKSFKKQIIKTIRKNHNDFQFQWQRSFHDHIIRNEKSLFRIRRYIRMNPKNWENDELY